MTPLRAGLNMSRFDALLNVNAASMIFSRSLFLYQALVPSMVASQS